MKYKLNLKTKLLLSSLILIIAYLLSSLIIFNGELMPIHYYSYDNIKECQDKGCLVSNNLKIFIEGDSLKKIKNLNSKFYSSKSMYEKFYGFLIHTNNEDKDYRRILWEEPIDLVGNRNWIILKDKEYQGEAFYSGFLDEKVGDTVKIEIQNAKTDFKIGTIKIIIE